MSRRCRPGGRARIIASHTRNAGAIVLVVRHHFGEEVSGSPWVQWRYPWVVTSLGAPLRCIEACSGKALASKRTIVVDDSHLDPLDDDNLDLDGECFGLPIESRVQVVAAGAEGVST